MRAAVQKLNNRRGVSILLAIMLLLVATMVSVTILSAALTAAHRVASDKRQEQLALAVDSSARLLRQAIQNSECTITALTVVEIPEDVEENPITTTYPTEYAGDGPLGAALRTAVAALSGNDEYSGEVSLTPDSYDDEVVVPAAVLHFTMRRYDEDEVETYPISGVVTVTGGDQKIYLTAQLSEIPQPETTEVEEGNITRYTTTQTLRWQQVDLSTGVQE